MTLARFPQGYAFVGLANIGGDELIYKLVDKTTSQEIFCAIFTFDQAHKKDYTELLSFIQTYTALDHRGLVHYRAVEAEPADLRLFFMTGTYNMNLAKLSMLVRNEGRSYCEAALWQVAAQLIDTLAYYNLPRTRQFGYKSTFLAAQSFPHCVLRPFSIVITSPFVQESDLLKLSTNQKQAALFPLLVKVIPGVITLGQLQQFQTTATRSSLSHMAPELLSNIKDVDHHSTLPHPLEAVDVWSIGSILYEMATGKIYDPTMALVPSLGSYSFELQSMLRSMLSMKQSDRPTLEDLLRTERIHTILSDIQTHDRTRMVGQPGKAALQSVELQAREVLAKLPYSTSEQAQMLADWQQELPSEPNYLLGVMNMIAEESERRPTPTGNRFMHTSTNPSQSLRLKAPQPPASVGAGRNTRYGRKMAKSPAGVQDSYTQLMQHALKNNLLKAKKAMDQVCVVFTDGTSALMLAAESNSTDVAKLLVSYECCLQSKDGLTALMYAAKKGFADMVSLLLNHESMMVDSRGHTALMHAIENGHIDCIRILVKAEANYTAPDGTTAGLLATRNISSIMKQFTCPLTPQMTPVSTQRAPDSRQTSSTKRSAALNSTTNLTASTGHQAVIDKLTIAQIVTTYEDTRDPATYLTCLMMATQHHSAELIQMFIHQAGCQTPKGLTALHIAVQELFVDGVALLAPREQRYTTQYAIHGFGFHRATALCLAALIGGRADTKAASQGDWPASSRNYFRSVSQYSFGNALSARTTTGSSRDSERAILSILNDLIPLEATYREPGTGKTALIAAATVGNAIAVRALARIEGGCKMIKGWTAMMCCVCRASSTTAQNLCTYIECINALVPYEQGITSECGWTALVYASAYLNLACIEVLAPAEAAMSGETALSFLGALVADNEMTKSEWQYSMSQARSLIIEHLRSQSPTGSPPTQQLAIGELPPDQDIKRYINNKSGLFADESEISILEGKYFRWEGPTDSVTTEEPTRRGVRASSGLYPQRRSPTKKDVLPDVSAIGDESFTRGQQSFQCQTSVNIPEQEKSYRYKFNSKPLPPLITMSPSTGDHLPILPPLNSHKIRN